MAKLRRKFSTTMLYIGHEERFFQQVEVGKTYKYYYGDFMFSDVKKIAKKYGVEIKHNPSSDMNYFKFGPYNFTVLSAPEQEPLKPVEPQLFDIKELAI